MLAFFEYLLYSLKTFNALRSFRGCVKLFGLVFSALIVATGSSGCGLQQQLLFFVNFCCFFN